MRSDEDIGRLLEDWLDDEARPMPRAVLESALESVGRTAQVGTRRRGFGWLGNRTMGMLLAGTLLVLIAVSGGLATDRFGFLFQGRSGEGPPPVWDPVAEWRSAPDQVNPSPDRGGNPGVWRYMRSTSARHNPAQYVLMPNYTTNVPNVGEAWNEPAMINVFVGLGAADPAIYFHPTLGVYAVLAWTSPVEGEVTIDGVAARPQDPCTEPSGGLRFSVDRGSQTLRTIGLDNGQRSEFNLTTRVGVGDTLYFVVDSDGDANCDLTSLQLTITLE